MHGARRRDTLREEYRTVIESALFLFAALAAAVVVNAAWTGRRTASGEWGYRSSSRTDGEGPYRSASSTVVCPKRTPRVLVIAGLGASFAGLAIIVFVTPSTLRGTLADSSSPMSGFLIVHAFMGFPVGLAALFAGLLVGSPARLELVRRLSLATIVYAASIPFRAVTGPSEAGALAIALFAVTVCAFLYGVTSYYADRVPIASPYPASIPTMAHAWRRARWRRRRY
jgi:hypothetical protein